MEVLRKVPNPASKLGFSKMVTSELDPEGQHGVGQEELFQARKE